MKKNILSGIVVLSVLSIYLGKSENKSHKSNLLTQNLEALSNDENKKTYLVVIYRNEEHTICTCGGSGDLFCCDNK